MPSTESELDRLARTGFEMFKAQVEEKTPEGDGDAAMPMWLLLGPDNDLAMVGTPFNNPDSSKDHTVRVIKGLIKKNNVQAYVFLSEAWAIEVSKKDWEAGNFKTPRQTESRKEVVQMVGRDRAGNLVQMRADIEVQPDGKRNVKEPEWVRAAPTQEEQLAGRFANMFEEN